MVGAVTSDKGMRIVGQYIMDYLSGLAIKTKYNNADAIRIELKTGPKFIVFANGYNRTSEQFIQGDTYGGVYLTEINLLDKEFITQSIKRMASVQDKFLFGTYNPRGSKHWFITEFLNVWEQEQEKHPDKHWLNFASLQMEDNPVFTEEMLEEARMGMDPESLRYRRDILNEEIDAIGTVYKITEENKIRGYDPKDYDQYIIVQDIGESVSATVFQLIAPYYNEKRRIMELHVLRQYHHRNNDYPDHMKKSPIDYQNDFADFIKESIDIFGFYPRGVFYDGTEQLRRDMVSIFRDKELYNINPKPVQKDPLDDRIYRMQSLIFQERLKINVEECDKLRIDLGNAEYDDKYYDRTGKVRRKEIFDEHGHEDTIVTLEYGSTFYKNLVK